jgi:hypothetical protein
MHPVTQFLLRQATAMDVPALRSLIELSVRQLQKDDYSSAQSDGALGHAAQRAGFSALEMGSTLTGVPLYALKGYVPRESVAVPLPNGVTLPIVHMVKVL